MSPYVPALRALVLILLLASRVAPAQAVETLRLGTLKFGTVNWLLDTIAAEGLEEKDGFRLARVEFATPGALTVALQAGEVDLVVSDWLWAMRERAEGKRLRFSPYSSALGALVAAKDSHIADLADLKGKKLGVAGSALDKSWLVLRAEARRRLGRDLTQIVEPIHGAPPLLSEQLKLGRLDAVLTYWPFAARLEAAGFTRVQDMTQAMAALGIAPQPPLVGFVWRESLDARKGEALDGFFRAVRDANATLKRSDAAWDRLRPSMRAADDAEFERLRDAFRAGIPGPWTEADTKSAAALFRVLAEVGGPALVGPHTTFDPALFRGVRG